MEYLLNLCAQGEIHPEQFITKRYRGIDKIKQAIFDMKNRQAIKIAINVEE